MVLFVLWLLHAACESWRHAATHPHIAETARGLHTHPRLSAQLRPFSFFERSLWTLHRSHVSSFSPLVTAISKARTYYLRTCWVGQTAKMTCRFSVPRLGVPVPCPACIPTPPPDSYVRYVHECLARDVSHVQIQHSNQAFCMKPG